MKNFKQFQKGYSKKHPAVLVHALGKKGLEEKKFDPIQKII